MGAIRMTQVTALILQSVSAGYRYGFDIMDATGLASGTVYPALRRMEQARLLQGQWEEASPAHRSGRPQRRFYELTESGEVVARQAAAKLASQQALMNTSLPPREAGTP